MEKLRKKLVNKADEQVSAMGSGVSEDEIRSRTILNLLDATRMADNVIAMKNADEKNKGNQ